MSNISANNPNIIKLENGKEFDISKLDSLIGKSAQGSIFSHFDSNTNLGGNTNNIFDKAEIEKIKIAILEMNSSEGYVSDEELANILNTELNQKDENKENFSQLIDEIEKLETNKRTANNNFEDKYKEFTNYTVQPGDTPLVIAKKLGLKGNEAKSYAQDLKNYLNTNNQLDKRGWLKVGQKIKLLGNQSDKLAKLQDYSEDRAILMQRYKDITQNKHTKKTEQNVTEEQNITKEQNQIQKIKIPVEDIRLLSIKEQSYSTDIKLKLIEYRKLGYKCEVIKKQNGYLINIPEKAEGNFSNFKGFSLNQKANNESITFEFDKNGVLINQTTHNLIERITNRRMVSYKKIDEQRITQDKDPIEIKIKLPEKYHNENDSITNNTAAQNAQEFAGSLEKNKAILMKKLNITNEQYDRLAHIAMALAEQETHYDAYIFESTNGDKNMQDRLMLKDFLTGIGYLNGPNHSWGITQINWQQNFLGENYPNKQLRATANSLGIYSYEDYKDSPEKSAILTMILLNNKRLSAESETWQNRLKENNAKIQNPDERITTDDIIVLQWNGMGAITKRFKDPNDVVTINDKNSGAVDKNGKKIKDGTSYARLIRAYKTKLFTVEENQKSRAKVQTLNVENQSNNGQLGIVVFMPKAYKTVIGNNEQDTELLISTLNKKTEIPKELKEQLIGAIKNNEIAFGNGLTESEAMSLTSNDIALILSNLNALKTDIQETDTTATIRSKAKIAQDTFRNNYLQSRQVVVNIADVPDSTIINALGSNDILDERLISKRKTVIRKAHTKNHQKNANQTAINNQNKANAGYYQGYSTVIGNGVNPYDSLGYYVSEQQRILAECAYDVAMEMQTGGLCNTGFKAAIETSGIDSKSNMVYPKGHPDWGKPINVAKDMTYYLDENPELYTEVKYVNNGDGTARELNSADIKNLPAGYIVVFKPGPGYEDQAGHLTITVGNKNGAGDHIDNLEWDNYVALNEGNGKGEHGTYKIYKINENVKVTHNWKLSKS